jgi:hypothetical protein
MGATAELDVADGRGTIADRGDPRANIALNVPLLLPRGLFHDQIVSAVRGEPPIARTASKNGFYRCLPKK